VAFVGDGARRHRARLERGRHEARFPEVDLFLAGELGRWAIVRLGDGEGGRPEDLRPLYLRSPDIRKPRP
jgi:hypothetical protein